MLKLQRETRSVHSIHHNVLEQREVACLRDERKQIIATFPIVGNGKSAFNNTASRLIGSLSLRGRCFVEWE